MPRPDAQSRPTSDVMSRLPKLLSRPWGPVWIVPIATVVPTTVAIGIKASYPSPLLVVGLVLWVSVPFLFLALTDHHRDPRWYRRLVIAGTVATVASWVPMFVSTVAVGLRLGYGAIPLSVLAQASPLIAGGLMALISMRDVN